MGIHVLRSERVGTLWCGLAVLACLSVEGWRALHPLELEPLAVADVLAALESMPGPREPGFTAGDVRGPRRSQSERRFRPAEGAIRVADLDSAGWTYWGLSPKQARAAVRYNKAVGGIRDELTLRRMRVLPEGWYDHHASALLFDEEPSGRGVLQEVGEARSTSAGGTKSPSSHHLGASALDGNATHVLEATPLNINDADSLALLSVKGIGPWVAGRILSARRRWGGFAEMGQLTEALDGWDSLATALSPLLYCDAGAVQRRCADTLTLDQWTALPGVQPKTARVLQRYVRHHQGGTPSQVLAHPLLDSLQSGLLSHYLCPCLQD